MSRSAAQHIQAGAIATALAMCAILVVPTPWGRITAIVFVIVGMVLLLVAPTGRP